LKYFGGTIQIQKIFNNRDCEMKKLAVCIFLFVMLLPAGLKAEDFLGVPIIPGGKTTLKTENRLEMTVAVSHDQVVEFYQKALQGLQDIKFRDWKESTYIEDDGNLGWHSITISKQDTGGTTIVILKDNWTWIIGTLILRFFGVFVVLLLLLIGMYISGAIISRFFKEESQASA
jgi:hypothetical protein